MTGTIEFDSITNDVFGIYPVSLPNIPAPEYDFEAVEIPGRDGSLHVDKARYKDIEIEIEFNYIGEPEKWQERWRAAKKWLSAKNSKLCMADDPEHFFKVYYTRISTNERVTRRIGRFTVTFVCAPYMYLKIGEIEEELEFAPSYLECADGEPLLAADGEALASTMLTGLITNPYDESKPLYHLIGAGECGISINGHWLSANVKSNMTIDTDRQVAYNANGERVGRTVEGDYADIYLKPGDNIIALSNDFEFSITPKWREL